MIKFKEVKAKTVLNKYRDNRFWCKYGISPYRGCRFACDYCDAVTEKYLAHENVEDFCRIIYVKNQCVRTTLKKIEG